MTDQIPDLSDFENLPLYDVVKNLAIETRKPRSLWLYRIARSACTEKEPLNDVTVSPLRLFPEDHWCIIQVFNTRTIRSHGIGGDFEIKPGRAPKRFESTTWQLKDSGLRAYKNLQDVHEVPHTETVLETEGVTINKKEFAKWCLASGYPLPKFWFGDTTQTDQTPAEQRKQLDESARQQAEEYASQERKRGTPEHVVVQYIQDTFGFNGVTLHDIIRPEDREKTPGAKNANLTRIRNKARAK